jgi:hypothetical protein
MLAADKQLLDARLRDELQQLRVNELNNIVQRFENCLTPSTLIAGFSFSAIVELEFLPSDHVDQQAMAEPVFYGAATAALSLALYVTTISTMGVIFGQRLQVQGTAEQGSRHSELVAELNGKFLWCLSALAVSMGCVVVASISVVWVKAAYGHGEYHSTSFISTGIVVALFVVTVYTMVSMYYKLHTWTPATAKLTLTAENPKAADAGATAGFYDGVPVEEFYMPADGHVRPDAFDRGSHTRAFPGSAPPVVESSALLACVDRGK